MNDNDSHLTLEICLKPIGYVKSELTELTFRMKQDIPPDIRKEQILSNHRRIKEVISELIIHPDYEELLDGIEAFSHIVVVFWPHLLSSENRQIKKVHPMGRKDLPIQGIFATRSPARPNPVLISNVHLLERQKNVLKVKGLEALNGSPLIDIKPVTRFNDGVKSPTFPDWINQINKDFELD